MPTSETTPLVKPTSVYVSLTGIGFAALLLSLGLRHPEAAFAEDNSIKIDGSSTVYPITEAVAEEFGKLPENRSMRVTVGISGTGGGFKKFCAGETDISDASRPIKATEIELCKSNSIDYVEIPVAYDALAVVVNPRNTWAKSLTVAELKKMWAPEAQGTINNWNQVRKEFPDKPLKLFGAGIDSGTYDYFTEAVVGKEHSSRGDFTSSEDDNLLVQGGGGDASALGFFGLAYYIENKDKLAAVAIDDENEENGAGAQLPATETVLQGVYQPLARPLFIYVRKAALEREPVKRFMAYYIENAAELSASVGYIKAPDEVYALAKKRFDEQKTGTIFAAGISDVGVSLAELMKKGS